MANVNPGPATTGTSNSVAEMIAVNTQVNSNPAGSNAIRCLAVGRGLNVNTTGDIGVLPVNNASRWNIQAVVASNMSVNAGTSVAIGLYTGALQVGTTIVSPVILSSLQAFGGVTVAYRPTVINTTYAGTGTNIYVNCQTTAGTACTLDVFIYGYDLS
jgi:hypothetical protein